MGINDRSLLFHFWNSTALYEAKPKKWRRRWQSGANSVHRAQCCSQLRSVGNKTPQLHLCISEPCISTCSLVTAFPSGSGLRNLPGTYCNNDWTVSTPHKTELLMKNKRKRVSLQHKTKRILLSSPPHLQQILCATHISFQPSKLLNTIDKISRQHHVSS